MGKKHKKIDFEVTLINNATQPLQWSFHNKTFVDELQGQDLNAAHARYRHGIPSLLPTTPKCSMQRFKYT